MKKVDFYLTTARWYVKIPGRGVADDGAGGEVDAHADVRLAPVTQWLRTNIARGARVRAFVSSALVRILSLPWSSEFTSGRSIQGAIRRAMALRNIDPDRFHVAIQWPRHGGPVIAIAYPVELLREIEVALAAAGARLDQVVASAAAIGMRYARSMQPVRSLLVYREDDGITGVHFDGHGVTEIEVLPAVAGGLDDLGIWLNRKRMDLPDQDQIRWLSEKDRADASPPAISDADAVVAGAAIGLGSLGAVA